jgi:glycosyltransferase involved in cell wall biosynthesis
MSYFSVCGIFRDEALYLEEWIEFHLLVGAERVFLYNNGSIDNYREIFERYGDETVVLREWPETPGLATAYEHCIADQRGKSRWIAFIDLDEFLFSPTGRPVPELLPEFEAWPAVCPHWLTFGSSGHDRRPEGLVIDNYRMCTRHWRANRWIKSIVDPERTLKSVTSHAFVYSSGFPVDENRSAFPTANPSWRLPVTSEKLRVNHYRQKSREDFEYKSTLPWPTRNAPRPHEGLQFEAGEALNEELDETILMYLPDLREAIARRRRASEPAAT